MSDPTIPPGRMAFLRTRTGFMDATSLPDAGVALRTDGDLAIVGGGEAFAAKLTADDMEQLGFLLLALAQEQRDAAADAAQAALNRLVDARPEGNA